MIRPENNSANDRLHLPSHPLTPEQVRALVSDLRGDPIPDDARTGPRPSWWSMIGQVFGLIRSLFSDEKGSKR